MSYTNKIPLGIIGSSGGSALAAASECLKKSGRDIEWIVVTDRKCGLGMWAIKNGYNFHQIEYTNADEFSMQAAAIFSQANCQSVLLFYTKRVSCALIDNLNVWNIHPSILPSFPGLNGLKDAICYGVKIFGATLHRVNAELDKGQIFAQVATNLPEDCPYSQLENISFRHKVWLTLVWFDILKNCNERPAFDQSGFGIDLCSPGLADRKMKKIFMQWLSNL